MATAAPHHPFPLSAEALAKVENLFLAFIFLRCKKINAFLVMLNTFYGLILNIAEYIIIFFSLTVVFLSVGVILQLRKSVFGLPGLCSPGKNPATLHILQVIYD